MTNADKPVQDLADLEGRIYKALGQDDRTGGEGPWYLVLQEGRSTVAAFPPPGTREGTLFALMGVIGGHQGDAEIDPAAPGDRRRAVLFGCVYQPEGAEETRGERPTERMPSAHPSALAEGGEPDELQPSTGPIPTGSPPAGNPPARAGDEQD